MRKIIVKTFALNYLIKINSSDVTFTRSSTPISFFLSVVIGSLMLGYNVISIIASVFLVVSLFFGFIYFKLPGKFVKWEELSKVQRVIYVKAKNFQVENEKIEEYFKYKDKRNNLIPILLNIISFLSVIILIFLI